MRGARRALGLGLAGAVCGLCLAVSAAAGEAADDLIKTARSLELADDPQWRALLHYEPRWFSVGVGSIVTSPQFFLSKEGSSNPQAELAATITALTTEAPGAGSRKAARCTFPARAEFLRQRLGLSTNAFPDADCQAFRQWAKRFDDKQVSLVFPTAYLNSPASIFGHTLLRLDPEGDGHREELLSFAVNFAAKTGENAGIEFAYRGLAGGYAGRFGVYRYYEKVKQYAWIENRDIWSYPLRLNAAERGLLVAHLWELRNAEFDYYFLSKNCSYQLLALLQAVRPGLALTPRFRLHAIPGETIRALASVEDLLGPAEFRPALFTRLTQRLQELADIELEWVRRLSGDSATAHSAEFATLPAPVRARLLELAHDHVYYRQQTGALAYDPAEQRLAALLLARSRIRQPVKWPDDEAPGHDPSQSHAAFRAGFGPRWSDEDFSLALELRPSYHDLLDPPEGFVPGASLGFLDARLLATPETSRLRLDYLGLVDIESWVPRGRLFKPVSWTVRGGLRRPGDEISDDRLGAFLEGGPGLAWGRDSLGLAYVQALGSVDYNNGYERGYAVGAGARAGLYQRVTPDWRVRAEVGGLEHAIAGDNGYRAWIRLEQRLDIRPSSGLLVRMARQYGDERQGHELSLLLQRHF